jgi:hypothetical protein
LAAKDCVKKEDQAALVERRNYYPEKVTEQSRFACNLHENTLR